MCEIIEGIVSYALEYGLSHDLSPKMYRETSITPIDGSTGILKAQKRDRYVLFSTHQVEVHLDGNGDLEHGFVRRVIFLLAPFDHEPRNQEIANLLQDTYPFYNQGADFEVRF